MEANRLQLQLCTVEEPASNVEEEGSAAATAEGAAPPGVAGGSCSFCRTSSFVKETVRRLRMNFLVVLPRNDMDKEEARHY